MTKRRPPRTAPQGAPKPSAGASDALLAYAGVSAWQPKAPPPGTSAEFMNLLALAEAAARGREPDAALAYLKRAVRLEPGSAKPPFFTARVLAGMGRGAEALRALHDAVRLEPGHAKAKAMFARLIKCEPQPDYRWMDDQVVATCLETDGIGHQDFVDIALRLLAHHAMAEILASGARDRSDEAGQHVEVAVVAVVQMDVPLGRQHHVAASMRRQASSDDVDGLGHRRQQGRDRVVVEIREPEASHGGWSVVPMTGAPRGRFVELAGPQAALGEARRVARRDVTHRLVAQRPAPAGAGDRLGRVDARGVADAEDRVLGHGAERHAAHVAPGHQALQERRGLSAARVVALDVAVPFAARLLGLGRVDAHETNGGAVDDQSVAVGRRGGTVDGGVLCHGRDDGEARHHGQGRDGGKANEAIHTRSPSREAARRQCGSNTAKWASTGVPPLIGIRSCGQAENATTQSISARTSM